MKFKIGDKVKVISLDKTRKCLGLELNNCEKKLLGKTVTIQSISVFSYFSPYPIYIVNGYALLGDDLQLVNINLEIE